MLPNSDEALVRERIEQWAKSVRVKDMKGVVSHHSADIRLFNVPEPPQSRGIDAYRDALQLYFDNAPTPAPYDLDELEITARGVIAFAHGLLHCSGSGLHDEPAHLLVRLTVCLEKRNGEWTVVHEHHSEAAALDRQKKGDR